MTQTPGPTAGPTHPTGLDRFFGWIRSVDLRRDTDEKWLAGVCSGIANRLGVDPIVIRAALVLLVVLGGVGITIYLIAWAFLPNSNDEIVAEKALRDGDVLGIILLVIIGLSLVGGTGLAGDVPGIGWIWWVVVPIGLVVWLVTRSKDGGGQARAATSQPAAWPSSPPTGGWASTQQATSVGPPFAPGDAPESQEYAAMPPTTPYAATPYAPNPYAPMPTAPPPGGSYLPPPAPPVPAAPRPPRPPKVPRRRSGGLVATLLIGGLAVAVYGATLWIHDAAGWRGSDETVALAAALGVLGAGVLTLGVIGRRAGFTGFLAIVLALITWSASVVPNVALGGGIGERVWRPSATDTTARYRLGIGSAELDLARLQDNPGTAREIDAGVGIGELRILIPDNLTVEVRSSVGAGDITRDRAGDFEPIPPSEKDSPAKPATPADPDSSDDRGGHDVSTVETFGTGAPDVIVTAHVGLGEILIGQE